MEEEMKLAEIVTKKITPLSNRVLVSMETYEEDSYDENGLLDMSKKKGAILEIQKVLAVGPYVRDVKVGDICKIDPSRYEVRMHEQGSIKDGIATDNPITGYKLNIVYELDTPRLMLLDSDLEYIISEWD